MANEYHRQLEVSLGLFLSLAVSFSVSFSNSHSLRTRFAYSRARGRGTQSQRLLFIATHYGKCSGELERPCASVGTGILIRVLNPQIKYTVCMHSSTHAFHPCSLCSLLNTPCRHLCYNAPTTPIAIPSPVPNTQYSLFVCNGLYANAHTYTLPNPWKFLFIMRRKGNNDCTPGSSSPIPSGVPGLWAWRYTFSTRLPIVTCSIHMYISAGL